MSMSDLHYWYSGLGGGGFVSDLPTQALPKSKKNKEWKRATMDSLERIAITQFNENLRFVNFYRMTQGKVSYVELSEIMPQLREVSRMLGEVDIPTTIKHYDVLGTALQYLESVLMDSRDKFHVTYVDEVSKSEREQLQTDLMQEYLAEQWDKKLNLKLLAMGINPHGVEFESEEQRQEYIQQLQAQKEALTPPEINNKLQKEWRPVAVEWAEATIEGDALRRNSIGLDGDELDRINIFDLLRTGRCFRETKMKYDSYESTTWNPISTFFSQTVDAKYPQYGEYVGRIHFYTPSDFVARKGSKLSEKEIKKILENEYDSDYSYIGGSSKLGSLRRNVFVPHEDYFDHRLTADLEDVTGVPLSTRTIYNKDGSTREFTDFTPRNQYGQTSNASRYARYLRDDLNIRTDMIQVTEAYFRSYALMGVVRYLDPNGLPVTELVTEDILNDFLKEYGISEVKNVSLEEFQKSEEINQICWTYLPEIWYGEKALTSMTGLREDWYSDVAPLPYQIRGNSDNYDVVIPVAGLVIDNPCDKVIPFQTLHNINMNAAYSLTQKEIGAFFIFDIGFLPSDIKGNGDTEVALHNMLRNIKETGLLGIDGSVGNLKGGSAFNQFTIHDLSLGRQIKEKLDFAEHFKIKAWEQLGISPQAMGQAGQYETAEGVRQGVNATNNQIEYLFSDFSSFKQQALEIHLEVARFAQSTGVDIQAEYTKSDESKYFLRSTDPYLPLRRFGIIPVSNSKKRRELEMVKSYILGQNTMDLDVKSIADVVSSDSMVSLIEIARLERMRAQAIEEQRQQHQLNVIREQGELEEKKQLDLFAQQEYSKEKDREAMLLGKTIMAVGAAADNNADVAALNYVKDTANIALKQQQQETSADLRLKDLEARIEAQKNNFELKKEEFNLKVRDMDLREKRIQADEKIALVNKN